MILLFSNKTKNIESQIFEEIVDYKIPTVQEFVPGLQQNIITFFAPSEQILPSCSYPLDVEELFPYWLRNNTTTSSNLILMTKKYYDWLSCGMTENLVNFFNLETMIDIDSIPNDLVKYQLFSYVNSFPADALSTSDNPDGNVDPTFAKKLFDNVKVNLYTKKGNEESFKLVLESLFGISSDKVSISYPKTYIMRLNGGRYDWMRDDLQLTTKYSANPSSFYPELNSYLNFSILQDSDLWQEFSYVLNISGLSASVYNNVVRPLVHPAGTKDFYDTKTDIFNNITDSSSKTSFELPIIKNYAMYSIVSMDSADVCATCNDPSGGPTGPAYVFPSWDVDISAKYYKDMPFGEINIVDFLKLSPVPGGTFPNENITCNLC